MPTNPILYTNYKSDAAQRGIPFTITRNQFYILIGDACIYCGEHSTGIDRVDNLEGYHWGNCVPCCRHCNQRKGNKSLAEFAPMALHRRLVRYLTRIGADVHLSFE